ncbi:hypothetical protein [Xenorhabdus innexi]|uniref:Transposase n=1 Tax=Xenorhabdus innexi TaxID=290109 RepID=A0A1N6MWS1_9GAMM|nr:hypothetical protein [Xenorhabdus innexi]PHM33291.1 hypothetical protein Xinn_02548 [Xenorhabdus innexi]SIP73281.1 hypothetical protein XIS1_1800004 [Xenorhabdus innexi]
MSNSDTNLPKKTIKEAYKPKTCPFCNFYGLKRYPENNSWSCNQCGLMWTPEEDKR